MSVVLDDGKLNSSSWARITPSPKSHSNLGPRNEWDFRDRLSQCLQELALQ